jgi:hypothetical protein
MKFAQELLQGLLERLLFWTIAVVIGALVLIVPRSLRGTTLTT